MAVTGSCEGELNMKPRLISFPLCPYVHRSRVLLSAKDVDYDIDYIDLADKPDWFLDRVPTGKVPALFVGDETLFESNVINEYLDDTNGSPLLPQQPLQRAREKAWIVFSDGLLMSLFRALRANNSAAYLEHKQALLDGFARIAEFVETRVEAGFYLGAFEAAVAPLLLRIEHVPDLRDAFWSRFGETSTVGHWSRQLIDHDAVMSSVPENFAVLFADFFNLDELGNSRHIGGLSELDRAS